MKNAVLLFIVAFLLVHVVWGKVEVGTGANVEGSKVRRSDAINKGSVLDDAKGKRQLEIHFYPHPHAHKSRLVAESSSSSTSSTEED